MERRTGRGFLRGRRALAGAAACAALLAAACALERGAGRADRSLAYPRAPRVALVERLHGTPVADPWRVLEDPADPRTREFVRAQAELAEAWLAEIGARDALGTRLEALQRHASFGAPLERGGRLFFLRQDGLAPQAVLCVAEADGSGERVLLDPAALAADGTISIAGFSPSPDGSLVAYGLSDGGSDWTSWRVLEVASGAQREDRLEWLKFSAAAWLPDGSGFFYARYPEPQAKLESETKAQRVHLHLLGRPQAEDRLVFERPDRPELGFGLEVTEDGELLVLSLRHGTRRERELWTLRLDHPERVPEPLRTGFDAAWDVLGKRGSELYALTDLDAARGRVVALALDRPGSAPRELVSEGSARLREAVLVGERLLCLHLVDASARLSLVELSGASRAAPGKTVAKEVRLPELCSVRELRAGPGCSRAFLQLTSFTRAPEVLELDARTGALASFRRPELDFDAERFVTRQVHVRSSDGTRVPLFLTRREDLAPAGEAPVLLYGYGGFDVAITPSFSVLAAAWLELGGVWAVAVLRGGGEFDREWYAAGTLGRKQNVFDDFVACAEWLIERGLTTPRRLAIHGRSNGGLLVGACLVRRPELFGAALPAVGVLDMLRYHRFTIGWAWAGDYGTADDPEAFRWLHAYSPVHNARPARYPATLITTGDHDDRVVPMHSLKFAAALQAAQRGPAPILLRVERRTGHGAGKPTHLRLAEAADQLAFLVRALDLEQSFSGP